MTATDPPATPGLNARAPDVPLALEQLYHWARTQPERLAFTQPLPGGGLRQFTWQQVLDETRHMAGFLQAQGFEPGARIAILSKNCAWWLMADWAIWMAGLVSVPLYPTLAASTVQQILAHSEARLVFVGKLDGWPDMAPGVPPQVVRVSFPVSPAGAASDEAHTWASILERSAPIAGQPVRAGAELATIMYTSGTTGHPKGVMHSFDNFAQALHSGLQRVRVDGNSRVLSYLPLAHIAERTLIEHGLLGTGLHLFFADSLDTFAADLRRARPTMFFSVPRLWVKFQQGVHAKMPPARLDLLLRLPLVGRLVRRKVLAALGLDACQFAAGGAAPMPRELLAWYARLGLPIVEVYGMTENCGLSHATLPGEPRPGTVGRPYVGVESRLDPASGEIQVRNPCMMLGYFKEPELTRAAFTDDGWLRTGDKGSLDEHGCLRITGRVKDLFKTSKGKYVAPAPIEDLLGAHPAIEACCVAGADLAHPFALVMLNAEAVAHSAGTEGRLALEDSLVAHLMHVNAGLDPHERLAALVLMTEPWSVDNGLVTPTFKVKRNVLEERFGDRFAGWAGSGRSLVWAHEPAAVATPTETRLAA